MKKEPPKSLIQYGKTLPYIENRDPSQKPNSYLVKDGENSYRVVEGRRPSKMLLVNKIREEVDKWRDADYPGVTNTTRELLNFWFYEDHLDDNGKPFKLWFCQREAIETLIYLYEVKKYTDIEHIINDYAEHPETDLLFQKPFEVVRTTDGKRKLIRYFPELKQYGEQELPPYNLLRFAFKMATGSGKTFVMAMVIVWSYFNRRKELSVSSRYCDNFLIVAPNVIVYERLARDFTNTKFFYKFIPDYLKPLWNIKITQRGDDSTLNSSGNLIINNIQQLYERPYKSPENIIEEILGSKPQTNLTKSPLTLLDKIKSLDNLIVINDEAHHVHDEELKWSQTLLSIHNSLPKGLTLWLDFSATPKDQNGSYYPWIIVDYPLAQAVEDRIVKTPLIVHSINTPDPSDVNEDNFIRKYLKWIVSALSRWKQHFNTYSKVGKKPVLFIMVEKNKFCDILADLIRSRYRNFGLTNPDDEVLVIHVASQTSENRESEITASDLPRLRELARKIDEPDNKVKIIISNLMLREGWDVQNVTIVLGLRPFTSKAQVLPEQAVGRGLRLMSGISPDHTQTLEVMGTEAFENFVRELEKEGVGINTVKTAPPLPVVIEPETSRLKYDIAIPQIAFRYSRNYTVIKELDPSKFPSLFESNLLDEESKNKIKLEFEFLITGTKVGTAELEVTNLSGRELCTSITREIIRQTKLVGSFSELYPIVESYILNTCFKTKIHSIDDPKLVQHLSDIKIQESIINLISNEIANLTIQEKEKFTDLNYIKLSQVKPFTWRRLHIRCKKTLFGLLPVYNKYEKEFAQFLDSCSDIVSFSSLADILKIDYISSRGNIRFYWPDFIAVQKANNKEIYWIIETRGREYEDAEEKERAVLKWCQTISDLTRQKWSYIKVYQSDFNLLKPLPSTFSEFVKKLSSSLGTSTIETDLNKNDINKRSTTIINLKDSLRKIKRKKSKPKTKYSNKSEKNKRQHGKD